MLQTKVQALKAFLHRYKDLPKQGTQAWLDNRGIGGSELDRLLKDEAGLVANKIGLTRIPDMLAMRWGSMLEDTLRNIVSIIFRAPIFEASSVPSAEVAGKTYSMDGMGIVRFLCDQWEGKDYEFFMFLTTLFEFKCPYSRAIKQGEIYRDYIPQVLSGMCDLGLPEIALYIEGVFRISRHEELSNSPHVEQWLHKAGNPLQLKPMSYGFIGFYMLSPDIPDDPEAWCLFDWLRSGQTDFAKLENPMALNRLLKFMKTEDVQRWSSAQNFSPQEFARCPYFAGQKIPIPHHTVDMDEQLVEFYKFCREHDYFPLGTLGIKLMDINVVAIEKEPGYTKKYETEIHAALEKIQILKSIEDMGEREIAYNEMYNKCSKSDLVEEDTQEMDGLDAYIC